jgi:hypothetical protein
MLAIGRDLEPGSVSQASGEKRRARTEWVQLTGRAEKRTLAARSTAVSAAVRGIFKTGLN